MLFLQSVPDQPGQHDDLQKIVSPFTEIEGDAAKLMAATKKKRTVQILHNFLTS